jgi:flagellar biosynthesis/type III secretory pathway protein FliH
MSALIKSGTFADPSFVRPLTSLPGSVSPAEQERDRLAMRIALLETELRQRDALAAELRAEAVKAFGDGKAHGRTLGLNEADTRDQERLSLMAATAERAHADLQESLSSLERLAALLARECLDIILGDANHRARALRKLLAVQMAKLEKSVVVEVAFSRRDFRTDEAVHAIAAEMELPAGMLTASDDLAPGACRMRLRLGQMEVGFDQQWGSLREVLDKVAMCGDSA